MYTCKPAKRSIIFLYLFILFLAVALTQIVLIFNDFLKIIGVYILIGLWVVVATYLLILFPLYYKKTRFLVSDGDIVKYTFLFSFKYQYMTMDSVKSVSTIITPLSKITGLNFIVINALGAKMFLPFLTKKECKEITEFLNENVSQRHKISSEE